MDYRAKLQAGLEEKKIQDREQQQNATTMNKPKPVQNSNKNTQTSNKITNDDNKSTSTTSTTPTKPKNNNNNNNTNKNNNNKSNNNNFGNKRGNQQPNIRVNYEGLTKLCVITDKKHSQVLRTLALYLGPAAFGSISSTCSLLENVSEIILAF